MAPREASSSSSAIAGLPLDAWAAIAEPLGPGSWGILRLACHDLRHAVDAGLLAPRNRAAAESPAAFSLRQQRSTGRIKYEHEHEHEHGPAPHRHHVPPISVKEIAASGRVELLSWAVESGCPVTPQLAATVASRAGPSAAFALTRWLREAAGCGWDARVCSAAAEAGDVEFLRWARAAGCPWDASTAIAAARGGSLKVLKWLRNNGCPWTGSVGPAGERAAGAGHLSVLQWLSQEGFTCNKQTVALAAAGGHLEVVKWLHEVIGCPWDVTACNAAAEAGHLDILKYAASAGCPCDASTFASAARGRQLGLLMHLRQKGCPWDWRTRAAAHQCGDSLVLKWIKQEVLS